MLLRTNKVLNNTLTNNIEISLLSSCSYWIILVISGLLLTQSNPSRAMKQDPDIIPKSESIRAQHEIPKTEFYKDTTHPLTQGFLKGKDLSKRLEKIQPYILDIKEKISNHQINKIEFNKSDLIKILECLQCDIREALHDVLHNELLIASYTLRPINGGRSGNEVKIASCKGKDLIAIKAFKNKEKGLQELTHSLVALALNSCPEQLKMARIYDAFICLEGRLNIIMEAANGKPIHQFLLTDLSRDVITSCAKYLATFHIENYCKDINKIDREEFTKHASDPYHTLYLNLLTEEEKRDFDLLDLSIGMRILEPDEKVTSSNIIKLLETIEEQINFKELVKKSCKLFEKNCGYIFRIEKTYPRTRTHGDAQKDNFLYDASGDLKDTNKKTISKKSLYRVTMIDFESIVKTIGKIGDSTEDIGRFAGSLWDLATELNNVELANDTVSSLQEHFIQTYLNKMKNSTIFSSEEDKKTFEGIFKENCNFYKLRFYRAAFNSEKDRTIKLQILKSWIKEASDLLGPIQKDLQSVFIAEESELRDWPEGKEKTFCPNLPDLTTKEFITSTAKGKVKNYLTELWEEFHKERVSYVAITGMGGVGKTTLALAYARESLKTNAYSLIYRIASSSPESLLKGYKDLLLTLGVLKDNADPIRNVDERRIIELVKKKLPPKSLLIFDNLGIPASMFLKDWMPDNQNIHTLITSRDVECWSSSIPLQVFRRKDSVKYLFKITGLEETDPNKKIAEELGKALGHFPLALAHAAHYIKLVGGDTVSVQHFKDYLEGFAEKPGTNFEENRNPLTEDKSKITYENLISKTLRMAEAYISTSKKIPIAKLAKNLIKYFSYLDSEAIAEEFFLEFCKNKEELDKTLELLAALSLIKRMPNEPLFSIHSLVQLVIRNEKSSKNNQEPQEALSHLVPVFNTLFEKNIDTEEHIEKLLNYSLHIFQVIRHSKNSGFFSEAVEHLEWVGKILFLMTVETSLNNSLMKNQTLEHKQLNIILESGRVIFKKLIKKDIPDWLISIAEQSRPAIQTAILHMYKHHLFVNKDNKKAFDWCSIAARQGNADAQCELGRMYFNGIGIEKNYQNAAVWYTRAAKQGNIRAQSFLEAAYSHGWGVGKDNTKAIKWKDKAAKGFAKITKQYVKAAGKGDENAQFNLGMMYEDGRGVEQDYKKAFELYTLLAYRGHVGAQNKLGMMYVNGRWVDQDYKEAFEWLTKATEKENPDAQFNLGMMYANGWGVKQDYKTAFKWYTLAANQMHIDAQYKLGVMYANSLGVERDDEKAVEWFTKAAEDGNILAQNNLGIMHANGRGTEQNYKKAFKYYTLAAEKWNADAQNNLGMLYANGLGVERDDEKAFEWWTKSAEEGNTLAQYNLGIMYQSRAEIEKNYELAIKYYALAADQEHVGAQYNLGVMYQNGTGVEKDYELALKYYTLAANQGHVGAQYNLGVMYMDETWIEMNYGLARKYYTLAANQEYTSAQYNLGVIYQNGTGVERNYELALKYYILAADQSHARAQYNLGLMYSKGHGVKENSEEALKWFTRAAAQEHTLAKSIINKAFETMRDVVKNGIESFEYFKIIAELGDQKIHYNLGMIYLHAQGVDRDDYEAHKWFTMAAEQGCTAAHDLLEWVNFQPELLHEKKTKDNKFSHQIINSSKTESKDTYAFTRTFLYVYSCARGRRKKLGFSKPLCRRSR